MIPPALDDNRDVYWLGKFKESDTTKNLPVLAEEAERRTDIRRSGSKRFLTQNWEGGSICDKTKKERKIEVQASGKSKKRC